MNRTISNFAVFAALSLTLSGGLSNAVGAENVVVNDAASKTSNMHCGHIDASSSSTQLDGAVEHCVNAGGCAGGGETLKGTLDQTARVEDAKRLIGKNQAFQLRAKQFHAAAEAQIDDAKRLSGQAEQLRKERQGLSMIGKIDKTQLQAAISQYTADLNVFKAHAGEYARHLQRFRSQIGECHDNDAEYQANLADYTLHCSKFHMPNVVAPHICGTLGLSLRETESIANQLRSDRTRMMSAEMDLRQEEGKLIGSLLEEPSLMAHAQTANSRALEEQRVAGEFARLAEEYKTLEMERRFITGEPPQPVTEVRARIKKALR